MHADPHKNSCHCFRSGVAYDGCWRTNSFPRIGLIKKIEKAINKGKVKSARSDVPKLKSEVEKLKAYFREDPKSKGPKWAKAARNSLPPLTAKRMPPNKICGAA